ncbi:MAG TPA: histidine kinase dimerization/phospho-acceptor domain-containing protein [Anaeromyxobacteraceae bacterium]|nr:histidine kinase dimerization/phospho-acceptor domain-containing protein [Anaeromyxobacteraceae bacterium]
MISEGSTLPDSPDRAHTTEEPLRLAALEHAMQAIALSRLAGGMAHDVKNPLNAMALQIALLGDKIGSGGDDLPTACAGNLASMRNQIVRIDELVRRFADLADPAVASTVDLGQLVSDVTSLFGHEARRRRATITCEATPGIVLARADAGRTARVVLGLVCRSLSGVGEGGSVTLRAATDGGESIVVVDHSHPAESSLAWIAAVAQESVRDMGGKWSRDAHGAGERMELRFDKEIAS